jgi:hypothetical protein
MDYRKVESLYRNSVNILQEFQDYRLEFFNIIFEIYTLKQSNGFKAGSVPDEIMTHKMNDYFIYLEGFKRKKADLQLRYEAVLKELQDLQVDKDDGIAGPMVEMSRKELGKVISIKDYLENLEREANKFK